MTDSEKIEAKNLINAGAVVVKKRGDFRVDWAKAVKEDKVQTAVKDMKEIADLILERTTAEDMK